MTYFKAHLGPLTKGYTAIILAVLGVAALFASLTPDLSPIAPLSLVLAGLLPGLYSVRGYEVDPGRLVIKRPVWSTGIDLSELAEASLAPKLVRSSISLWGTRGMFGFVGYSYKRGVGTYRSYVTNPSKAVLLVFRSGKKVVISPDSPDDFLATLPGRPRQSQGPGR